MKSDSRGRKLSELFYRYDMVICKKGNTPTFSNANGSSFIFITNCTTCLTDKIVNWQVDDEEVNLSPPRNILFEVSPKIHRHRWNVKSLEVTRATSSVKNLNPVKSTIKMESAEKAVSW